MSEAEFPLRKANPAPAKKGLHDNLGFFAPQIKLGPSMLE
jgi:hypothetical protein